MAGEPNLPQPEVMSIWRYLKDFAQWNRERQRGYVPLRSAVDSILLQAPNGKVYQITVSNTGVLTSTLVLG